MSEKIKELENTPEKAIYQVGEGKDALTLSITTGATTYKSANEHCQITQEPANYIEISLSSNNVRLFYFNKKDHEDAIIGNIYKNMGRPLNFGGKKIDHKKLLSERLFDDSSKEAVAVKKFLSQIKGNALVDEINKLIEGTPLRREEELRKQQEEKSNRSAEEQKRQEEAKQKKLTEAQNKENAGNALNKFVGVDKQEAKDAPAVPEKGLKKYRSGINGLQYLKNLRTKMAQFFSRDGRK